MCVVFDVLSGLSVVVGSGDPDRTPPTLMLPVTGDPVLCGSENVGCVVGVGRWVWWTVGVGLGVRVRTGAGVGLLVGVGQGGMHGRSVRDGLGVGVGLVVGDPDGFVVGAVAAAPATGTRLKKNAAASTPRRTRAALGTR